VNIFRFSVWEEQTSIPPDILTWFQHFERKGIPAAILKRPGKGRDYFSVWRAGDEHGDNTPETLPTAYVVVKSCCGFFNYL
jgi:hypothetical protein